MKYTTYTGNVSKNAESTLDTLAISWFSTHRHSQLFWHMRLSASLLGSTTPHLGTYRSSCPFHSIEHVSMVGLSHGLFNSAAVFAMACAWPRLRHTLCAAATTSMQWLSISTCWPTHSQKMLNACKSRRIQRKLWNIMSKSQLSFAMWSNFKSKFMSK